MKLSQNFDDFYTGLLTPVDTKISDTLAKLIFRIFDYSFTLLLFSPSDKDIKFQYSSRENKWHQKIVTLYLYAYQMLNIKLATNSPKTCNFGRKNLISWLSVDKHIQRKRKWVTLKIWTRISNKKTLSPLFAIPHMTPNFPTKLFSGFFSPSSPHRGHFPPSWRYSKQNFRIFWFLPVVDSTEETTEFHFFITMRGRLGNHFFKRGGDSKGGHWKKQILLCLPPLLLAHFNQKELLHTKVLAGTEKIHRFQFFCESNHTHLHKNFSLSVPSWPFSEINTWRLCVYIWTLDKAKACSSWLTL